VEIRGVVIVPYNPCLDVPGHQNRVDGDGERQIQYGATGRRG